MMNYKNYIFPLNLSKSAPILVRKTKGFMPISASKSHHSSRIFNQKLFMVCLGLLLMVCNLIAIPTTRAQTGVETIEQVTVEIWPDYDRPAVLVLITGTLPAGTALPATVNVPLPAEADINAVARLTIDNQMIDDVQFSVTAGAVSLVATEQRFRVEYYMPYESNGDLHTFTYSWAGQTAVSQFEFSIQQPRAAVRINTTPGAETILPGSDGLNYHTFPPQSITPGQPFSVAVEYNMPDPQLTVGTTNPLIADLEPSTTTSGAAANVSPGLAIDWPLILTGTGLLLILVAGGWQIALQRGRKSSTPSKPKPRRKPAQQKQPATPVSTARPGSTKANFCTECGAALQRGDRFCRQCGAGVKQ